MLLVCFVCGLAIGQEKYKTIVVEPKQSLYSIARDYGVSAAELKKLNAEYAPDFQLKIGDKFKIPATGATAPIQTDGHKVKTETISSIVFHTVKKGETLSLIAQKYGMTQKELRALNYMGDKSVVKIGQKLKVKKVETVSAKVVEKNEVVTPHKAIDEKAIQSPDGIHIVQKGETLFFIAKTYGTTIRLLSDWNNLGDNPVIKVGQTLRVKGGAAPPTTTELTTYRPINTVIEEVVEKNQPDGKTSEPAPQKTEDPTLVEIKKSEVPAKETVPTDNPPAPKVEPVMPEKTIDPVPELPKVVSAQLENDYKEAENPATKRTFRGIGVAVNNSELTSAAFVLYDHAEVGDIVKVANLMSKKVMYLKVIGKMQDATEETILQVSPDAAKMLQANEDRFLVEVTGY